MVHKRQLAAFVGLGWFNSGIAPTPEINTNTWYHFAVVITPPGFQIFVDGVLVHDVSVTHPTTATELRIGGNHTDLACWRREASLILKVYDYALSAEEGPDLAKVVTWTKNGDGKHEVTPT